ncbi:MAG: hypothetical protein AAF745_16300, partial [Planctomycetota bacterium]
MRQSSHTASRSANHRFLIANAIPVFTMFTRIHTRALFVGLIALGLSTAAQAQITTPTRLSAVPRKTASLEEYLVNRLRATTIDQKSYVREIVRL